MRVCCSSVVVRLYFRCISLVRRLFVGYTPVMRALHIRYTFCSLMVLHWHPPLRFPAPLVRWFSPIRSYARLGHSAVRK